MRSVVRTPDGLVLTSRQVMYEEWPVLLVTHDADDGAWQFVNGWGDTDDASSAMLVHPEHLVERDASLMALADLPLGWRAWRRTAGDEWNREPQPPEDEGGARGAEERRPEAEAA